jgi:putative addiction module component (TIGR02574 family)
VSDAGETCPPLATSLIQAHISIMNERIKILSEEAAKLTPDERAELVERINLTLLDRQAGIDAAWDKEIERRLTAYRRGEAKTFSWEEIKADWAARRGHPVSE